MDRQKTLHITTVSITAYCFLRSWFRFLTERGHRVVLASTADEYVEEITESGAEVVNIPIARALCPWKDCVSLYRLWRYIRKEKFDFVHTYTTKAGFLGRLAARLAGVPVIIHTIYDPPHNSARNPLLKRLYIGAERLASRWADYFVTISDANYGEIMAQRLVPADRLQVIRLGIDLDHYRIAVDRAAKRESLGIPPSSRVVGIVARLEAAKGHCYLLEAARMVAAEMPEAFFVIVGRGRLKMQLEAQARELGIGSKVLFTGFREDMLEIMSIFDLFTLPSLWEGLGIVLLEAMAFSLPVAATSVGGIKDVVIDQETGLLVPPRNAEALASALLSLLRDRERARHMGEMGYRRVESEFRDSRTNEMLMELYERLFQEKRV